MAKRLLADALWAAANECLWTGEGPYADPPEQEFTCHAVIQAVNGGNWFESNGGELAFLQALGCDSASGIAFDSFRDRKERQGVRYMWLLLAMHVAADEGIEV